MSDDTEENIRRQVPDDDSDYQVEREKRRTLKRDHFGEVVELIDKESGVLDRMDRSREALIPVLTNSPDVDPEEANSRLLMNGLNELFEQSARQRIEDRNTMLRNAFASLMTDLILSHSHGGDEGKKAYIDSSIANMFAVPEIQDELEKHFGKDLADFTMTNFLLKLHNKAISNELLQAMAKRHLEDMREQDVMLQKIFEETKAEFKTAVKEAVDHGTLPQAASAALNRIDSIVAVLSDRLLDVQSRVLGSIDDYGRIRINGDQVQASSVKRLRRTIFHELLHALSGLSITLYTKIVKRDDWSSEFTRVSHRKSGVALQRPDLMYSPYEWLNEAITEWLALELSGYSDVTGKFAYKGSSAYPYERRELDRLFAAGLERDTVLNAYFENFVDGQAKAGKGQHFTKLVQRINEIDGPAGFTKIENKHIMREVKDVMYKIYIEPVEDLKADKNTVPPGAKIFHIKVKVGKNPKTQITEEFIYVAKSSTDLSSTIFAEEYWEYLQRRLNEIKKKYGGKVDISVVEE